MAKEINLLELDKTMKSSQPFAFGKGISLAANFDLGSALPLDSRIVVDTIEERDAHVTGNRAYEGMLVFVKADSKTYQLVAGEWEEFGFNEEKFQEGIAPLVSKDAEQDGRLEILEGLVIGGEGEGISGVIADVAKNTADIADLRTDLTELEAKVDTNTTNITTVTGDLATEVSNREAEIVRVEGKVDANTTAIETVAGDLATEVSTRESEITRVEGLITAGNVGLEADLTALEAKVDTNTTNITTVTADLASEVSTREAEIVRVEGKVDANAADIISLNTNLTTLEGAVSTLSSDLQAVETSVSDLAVVVENNRVAIEGALATEVSTREAEISKVYYGSATPEEVPTYDEQVHVAGDIVMDAEGNLCIVEVESSAIQAIKDKVTSSK